MIYWINGAYGVGKSTVAEQLRAKLPKAHIFDAEEVGNAVRDNYGDIIVPMTLVLDVSYTEIIQRLTDCGISVGYVILDGDRQTIHDRIIKRGEDEECWCMNNIQTCLDAQCGDMRAEHINTVGRTPGEIADEIIERFKKL